MPAWIEREETRPHGMDLGLLSESGTELSVVLGLFFSVAGQKADTKGLTTIS